MAGGGMQESEERYQPEPLLIIIKNLGYSTCSEKPLESGTKASFETAGQMAQSH